MAILNIFKKKKSAGKEKKLERKEIKEPVKKPKEEIKIEASPLKIKKDVVVSKKEKKPLIGEGWRMLQYPHITEKATSLTSKNQYTFNVWQEAKKVEIKKAIESIYGVDVVKVNIINIHPKKRKLGRTIGRVKGYKKAIVKIKEGQKIEVLPR